MKVVLTEDFPGVPKGAVLEKRGDNYVNDAYKFWLSAKVVDADPQRFPVSDGTQQ